MILREDILSMEYLKKTEYTACHQGMRYRMEQDKNDDGETKLKVTIWPEPFNFVTTPQEEKESKIFDFSEDGIMDAVGWMNDRLFEDKEKWDNALNNWSNYQMK